METRTITEIKIWVLTLNPMTDRAESGRIAALAFDKETLVEFYHNEMGNEFYQDGGYNKIFKKGGPLEWFNSLGHDVEGEPHWYNHGITNEWIHEETLEDIKYKFTFINK